LQQCADFETLAVVGLVACQVKCGYKLLGWDLTALEVLENFLFTSMSGMVVGCTYPPVRWVPDGGDLSSEVNASRT